MHGRMLRVSRPAAIGEYAAGVAHELNQPLTAIANYAAVLSATG
jgi:C4-dicarboxylate-specific signal transduction histidine kinase